MFEVTWWGPSYLESTAWRQRNNTRVSHRLLCLISFLLPDFLIFLQNLTMSDVEGIKSFLYGWLQKNRRAAPEYTFMQRPAGRGRQRFICEVRVEGMSYVGMGNSINKKDAQTNAARDFTSFLVREGLIADEHVPSAAVFSSLLLIFISNNQTIYLRCIFFRQMNTRPPIPRPHQR